MKPKDTKKIAAEVAEMRSLIEKEKPAKSIWDLKLIPGGLIDLEFIAQAAAMSGRVETLREPGTHGILQALKFEKLTPDQQLVLSSAHQIFSSLTQILRLCLREEVEENTLSKTLLEIMCIVAELPDTATLEAHVKDTARQVRSIFNQLFR
jgi:glutamate-ammonia-ligase adenylyltransferase